jgi:hypothetical protein
MMAIVTVNQPSFLTGLARDVIEHGDCGGCKVNAAMGLAAPEGVSRDEVDRLLEHLMADFGAAIVARGAHLHDASRRDQRLRQPED